MKIGVLGSGEVGKTLSLGFIRYGHDVMIGTEHPEKIEDFLEKNKNIRSGGFAETSRYGEIIVLAVKGKYASDILKKAGMENLGDKIIIDTTNPISDEPPENGVLKFFTDIDNSLMENLQKEFQRNRFVKAFNIIGSPFMVNPNFSEKPTMFICGNDLEAKNEVKAILERFGFEVEDMGKAESARAIEPLCILWCIPGFLKDEWNHAFRLIRTK